MEIEPVELRTEQQDTRPLPWSKPELRRLAISLDTQAEPRQPLKIGSAADAFFGVGFPAGG